MPTSFVIYKKESIPTLYATGDNSDNCLGIISSESWGQYGFVQVNEEDWLSVDTGYRHSVAVRSDGTLWGAGDNSIGQLGMGTGVSDVSVFTQIGTDTDWVQVATGYYFSVALKSDGTLWSCGYNQYGMLGLGIPSGTNVFVFTEMPSGTWQSVSVFYQHQVAIHTDGSLWTCGMGNEYALGLGDDISRDVLTLADSGNWAKVAAGWGHTMAIKSDGTMWGCGGRWSGAIGLSEDLARPYEPYLVQIGTDTWNDISCGETHSAGIKSNGKMYSTGYNSDGQLGLGHTINFIFGFTEMNTDTTWLKVSCGGWHTVGVKGDGIMWGCGENYNGALGYPEDGEPGGVDYSDVLIQLNDLFCSDVFAGPYRTFALLNEAPEAPQPNSIAITVYRTPIPVYICTSTFPDCVLTCTEDPYPSGGAPITGTDGVFAVGYYGETAVGLTTNLALNVGPITVKSTSCFVDAFHLYLYNSLTSKIEKYLKSDLSLVDSLSGGFTAGCADSDNLMWLLSSSTIYKYTKTPFALDHTYAYADLGEYAGTSMKDIAVDDEYIYIADDAISSIQRRMKQCLCLDQKVGDEWVWGTDAEDIAVSGDYVYISTYYNVVKANKDTWEIVELLGNRYSRDRVLGRPESGMFTSDVMTYNGYLYVLGYYGIARWSESDLTVCGKALVETGGEWDVEGSLNDAWEMCTDGTYLYTCDWSGMVIKFNLETGAYVAEYGDRTYTYYDAPYAFSFPFGIDTDGTYVYVLDQNDNFRVVKLLSSDMSYVTEYRSDGDWKDIGGYQWSNPQSLMYHDGYLYVSDPNYISSISRIDPDTMLYVDTTIVDFDPGNPGSYGNGEMEGMAVDGNYMYVANYHYNPCAAKLTFPGLELVSTHPLITNLPDVEIMGKITGITVDETYVYATCNVERVSNPPIGENEIRIYNKLTLEFVDSFPVVDGKPRSPAINGEHIYFTITNTTYSVDNTDYVKKCLKASPYTEIDSYASVGADFRSCDIAGLYQLNQ